jgi:hypothetical protein
MRQAPPRPARTVQVSLLEATLREVVTRVKAVG